MTAEAPRATPPVPNGVLVVDKPQGPTSHDLVAAARSAFATRAVGHAGTLDPMATGVLLLLIGEATKLSPYLSFEQKRYVARVRFGSATDSLDAFGRITSHTDLPEGGFIADAFAAALAREAARTEQVPPAVSAIHVDGERAHALHRRGLDVTLAPRPVRVFALTLLDAGKDAAVVDLTVSKGYYVRAFARDLAAALGTLGHLDALRRVASGPFRLEDAVAGPPSPSTARPISLADAARRVLPACALSEGGERRARCGLPLAAGDFEEGPPPVCAPASAEPGPLFAWLSRSGALVAIGREVTPGSYRVSRGFRPV